MQMSEAGLELLKRSEGFRGRTYLDAAGLATIGYGHQLVHPECFPNGITEAQAAEILAGSKSLPLRMKSWPPRSAKAPCFTPSKASAGMMCGGGAFACLRVCTRLRAVPQSRV